MEYKTVRGGDEFLPFARNLVRKLRAAGLSQAAQKVNVGSVSITVRIADENDFISIEGGAPTILSGVIKAGEVVNIPADPGPPVVAAYDTLRAFKPTQNCWDTTLRKNPDKPTSSFNDEKKLAKAGTQYADLAPSMFSGLMAKAVQVLMGMGIEVKYKYEFDKGHGIVLDSKGKPWLVEISRVNGVIAQKLGITPIGKNSGERNDALRKCVELFGGTPNGKTFPKDAALTEAIEAKSVLRLATVLEMKPFFDKLPFAAWAGWSFDLNSTARNTCFDAPEGEVQSYLYELVINITRDDPDADTSASGTAVLTQLETGFLKLRDDDVDPFSWNHDAEGVVTFPTLGGTGFPANRVSSYSGETTFAPVWVVHNGAVFDVVRLAMQSLSSVSTGPTPAVGTNTFTEVQSYFEASYITSTLNPQARQSAYAYGRYAYGGPVASVFQTEFELDGTPIYGYRLYVNGTSDRGSTSLGPNYGLAVNGTRDCYALFLQGDYQVQSTFTFSNYSYFFPDPSATDDHDTLPSGPPTSVQDGPHILSDPNDVTRIVLSDTVTVIQNPTLSPDDKTITRYLWANPLTTDSGVIGPRFCIRSSVFPRDHFEISSKIWSATADRQGSNFAPITGADLPPSTYNFIGYLA